MPVRKDLDRFATNLPDREGHTRPLSVIIAFFVPWYPCGGILEANSKTNHYY